MWQLTNKSNKWVTSDMVTNKKSSNTKRLPHSIFSWQQLRLHTHQSYSLIFGVDESGQRNWPVLGLTYRIFKSNLSPMSQTRIHLSSQPSWKRSYKFWTTGLPWAFWLRHLYQKMSLSSLTFSSTNDSFDRLRRISFLFTNILWKCEFYSAILLIIIKINTVISNS